MTDCNPQRVYVYQPLPPQDDGKFYGVGGLDTIGIDTDNVKVCGVTFGMAKTISKFCNDNPEFALSFIQGLKQRGVIE